MDNEERDELLSLIDELREIAEEALDTAIGGCARAGIREVLKKTPKQSLADHDAEVIRKYFKELAEEYSSNGLNNKFTGFEVSQHVEAQASYYANQLKI
jgi:hypothetical protein